VKLWRLVAAQGLGFWGAMFGMADTYWSASSQSLSGLFLLLGVSSKRTRGVMLVEVTLKSRLSFSGVLHGSDTVLKPCATSPRHSWLDVGKGGSFIIGFVEGTSFGTWQYIVVHVWSCSLFSVVPAFLTFFIYDSVAKVGKYLM
jgi:hypothetical protein